MITDRYIAYRNSDWEVVWFSFSDSKSGRLLYFYLLVYGMRWVKLVSQLLSSHGIETHGWDSTTSFVLGIGVFFGGWVELKYLLSDIYLPTYLSRGIHRLKITRQYRQES